MAGREGFSRSSFRTIAVLTLLPVAGLLAFLGWRAVAPNVRSTAPPARPARVAAPGQPSVQPAMAAATPKEPERRRAPAIVLILDDFGFEGQPIERAMALDPEINFAILPNGNRAANYADRLHERGFEILVHLPMEPVGSASPGKNAILTSMSTDEIERIVRENVRAVPHASGVNNHMGSRATADRRVMSAVLRTLPKGMYFVDSRTGGRSVAADLAREMKIRTATRHVFLDPEPSAPAVRKQLEELASIARRQGFAVGIAHPYPVTLTVLAEEIPRLRDRGFRFLRASAVVN